MKIKIIDLLNMISKGEELPKKIKYKGDVREYDDTNKDYVSYLGEQYYLFYEVLTSGSGAMLVKSLNDEVEIIEEDKKDKEIEVYINGEKVDITDIYEPLKQGEYFYKENDKWYVHKLKYVSKIIEEDKKIELLVLQNFTSNQKKIARKVNEIIDYINKGD